MCCSDLEMLFINCKPFYSPQEICSFILVSVYIPLQAHVSLALLKLADQITDREQKHPDSVLIILFKANISRELPKKQTACYMSHQTLIEQAKQGKRTPYEVQVERKNMYQ